MLPDTATLRPLVAAALDWARENMPGTSFVADAAWVLNEAQSQPKRWCRRRREFAVVSRVTNSRVHRNFYGLLAWTVLAMEREEHARRAETRFFADHEQAVHGAEPDSKTLRECQRESRAAA